MSLRPCMVRPVVLGRLDWCGARDLHGGAHCSAVRTWCEKRVEFAGEETAASHCIPVANLIHALHILNDQVNVTTSVASRGGVASLLRRAVHAVVAVVLLPWLQPLIIRV